MVPEINPAGDALGLAVLLHPHPQFGGDRFHPFVDALFRTLPDLAVSALRFDFSSAEPSIAREEVVAAIDEGATRWPGRPVLVIGYSFGAGIAAGVGDERIAGWYLLAPPLSMLTTSTIGSDTRPKAVVVPEYDQFSPPAAIAPVVAGWEATTVTTLPNTDHFLGAVQPIAEETLHWVERTMAATI
jgi:alpha/beta superfamily hydrolase